MNRARILVVEDEAVVSQEIAERLNSLGYESTGRAESAEQCLKLVELQRPDLVLMDIRIKGATDGIAAAEEIHRRFHTPVVFMTGGAEETTLKRAVAAEAYGCVFKPIADWELKSAIEIALYKHRTEEEILRLNRLYDVLSQVNQCVVHVVSREEMLTAVCRIIVERGAIDLAWVGWLDPDSSTITPIAHFGSRDAMLREACFCAGDDPEQQGNPGRAIREGLPFICNDCGKAWCPYPQAQAPSAFGLQSCGSFPLRFQGGVCGVLSVCTAESDFFVDREVHLFEEVAIDVSFALDKIEAEAQRRRTEAALRESHQRMSALFERARDAILIADPETGIILDANAQAERLLGRPLSELVGLHFTRIHPPEDVGKYVDAFGRHSESEQMLLIEAEIVRPDGSRVPVEVSGGPVDLGDGQRVIQGLFRDITERKAAQRAIERQRETLMRVFDSAPMIMMLVDRTLRVDSINRTGALFAGRPEEELVGKLCGEVFHCVNASDGLGCGTNAPCGECPLRSRVAETFGTGRSLFNGEGRVSLRRGGGEEALEILVSTALIDPGGAGRVLVSIADITERRRAQQERERLEGQLREAQRLEAIGTLAGGIAHDFNNILAPILGYTEMALGELAKGDSTRDLLEQVLKAANRAKDLVQQILAFSRHEKEKPLVPMNVGLIAKEALKLLRAMLPSTIEIRQHIESGVAVVDATQIHQVIVNLCTNAAHAMDERGLMNVSLKRVALDEEDLEGLDVLDLQPGLYLKLSVADSGHGMDDETIARIFDPYFTTKTVGKGTGLGLSVVHGIVQRHGGKIVVRSTPGRGSVFDVYLPADEGEPERPLAVLESLPGGSERILLVDDEEMIAGMAARMLRRLGYEVTAQTDARAALECFRANPQAFDLILSDYTMPGMTGIDLAEAVLRDRPGMPIIVCTGHSEALTKEIARAAGVSDLALKPLARRELAEMVRRVLDAKQR